MKASIVTLFERFVTLTSLFNSKLIISKLLILQDTQRRKSLIVLIVDELLIKFRSSDDDGKDFLAQL